jgi:hypothetical protein
LTPFSNHSDFDINDWLLAHGLTANALSQRSVLRSEVRSYNDQEARIEAINSLTAGALSAFDGFAFPTAYESRPANWLYYPEVEFANAAVRWHPLLADYLVAFALSAILRYQPHLFEPNTKSHFVAEAWCAQSAAVVARHFLMELTVPPKRIQTYS